MLIVKHQAQGIFQNCMCAHTHTPSPPETVGNTLSQENTPSPLLEAMMSKFF